MTHFYSQADNFAKHLGFLRTTYGISQTTTPSPTPTPPPQPPRVTQRPQPSSPTSPRLVRPPNVPDIYEEDEPADEGSYPERGSPKRRPKVTKIPRMSIPEAPRSLPTPDTDSPIRIDFVVNSLNRKKPSRRQSGILVHPQDRDERKVKRPLSPAPSSPARHEIDLVEDGDEDAPLGIVEEDTDIDEVLLVSARKTKSEIPMRKVSKSSDRETDETARKEDKKKKKALSDYEAYHSSSDSAPATKRVKSRLQDVTNSPSPRLSPVPPADGKLCLYHRHTSSHWISDAEAISIPTSSSGRSVSPGLPTPRPSSPVADADSDAAGGRERRVRKSVNYAEPKLNTYVIQFIPVHLP